MMNKTNDAAAPLQNITQKRILLINDLSCFGKCSLSVSLPIFAACDIEAVPLPTALLSTHTGGFPVPYILPLGKQLEQIVSHWQRIGLTFDAICTGYLCGEEQIAAVEHVLDVFGGEGALRVVDPVMGDGGRLYHGFDLSFARRMRSLCRKADIITPNATEAALLCDVDATRMREPEMQREVMAALGELCGQRVMTGVMSPDGRMGYLFPEGGEIADDLRHDHVDRPLHGCGDVFASGLCCAVLRGRSFAASVRLAAEFTLRCIRKTLPDAPHHWYGLRYEAGLAYLSEQLGN